MNNPMADRFLGDSLIFLISQPRAGSTLLQHILAGHPQIQSAPEPWIMLHPVHALRDDPALQAPYDAHQAYLATQHFLAEALPGGEDAYLDAIRAFAATLYGRAQAGGDAQFFLDKTPRYYHIIPELHKLFPHAKFVFLLRNPLAVLFSILNTWVNDHWSVFHRYADDLRRAPELMLAGIEALGPDAIVIRYDDLVLAPHKTVEALCERLNLAFDAGMLTYGQRPLADSSVVGDPTGLRQYQSPTAANLEKWHRLGESRQQRHLALAYLDDLGADTVTRLGYDVEELRDTIANQKPASPTGIVPWSTIVRPWQTWSLRERLNVDYAQVVQHRGHVLGTWLFVVRKIGNVLRRVAGKPRNRTSSD